MHLETNKDCEGKVFLFVRATLITLLGIFIPSK
jgi:hypothetical protein